MSKRFTYVKNNSISQYSVLPIQEIGGKTYHCQGVVDMLNKLNDENEQLKSICQDHHDHANDFKADCMRLEKENEQLKDALNQRTEQCDTYYKENEQLKHQNELLSDELEQCKAVINKQWSEYLKEKELKSE